MFAQGSTSTPTHLPPPPRKVRGGAGCALWPLRLFILPHVVIGLGLLNLFLIALLVAAFGTDLMATVFKAYTSHTSKGGTIYHLDYRYTAGCRDYTNSKTVGEAAYASLAPNVQEGPPPKLRIRYLSVGPWHYHLVTQNRSPWTEVGTRLLMALFWNGILSVFVNLLWLAPLRQRRLVRNGQAAPGTVLATRVREGRSTDYYATFRFKESESEVEIEREMKLPGKPFYELARPGLAVTVLYHPRNPRRALVYELCGYTVEPVTGISGW